jgi:hypothetical protein
MLFAVAATYENQYLSVAHSNAIVVAVMHENLYSNDANTSMTIAAAAHVNHHAHSSMLFAAAAQEG